jgi:hypothetical protein
MFFGQVLFGLWRSGNFQFSAHLIWLLAPVYLACLFLAKLQSVHKK